MRVARAQLRDFYLEADRAVVMVGENVVVLSEVATSILTAVPDEGSARLADIVDFVVAEHGKPEPPADAESLTRRQVLDLVAHRVLEVSAEGTDPQPIAADAPRRVLDAVRDALRTTLATVPRPPWTLPPDVSDQAFARAVQRQRITSQLATRLTALQLTETLTAQLSAQHAQLATAGADLALDLHSVIDSLDDAGVRVLVFKGQALAAQAWGDPAARGHGDIDLLVSPADLGRAYRSLTDSGWRTDYTYPSPGRSWGWRHFVRTEYEMALARGRSAVDLHWHAVPDRDSFPGFEELWARRAEVVVRGRAVPTFNPYDALAHSASHSAKDHWRWLRGLADVHRLMADPNTWLLTDRPLTGDQLLTVGIAARLFGVPDGAPRVVSEAAASCEPAIPLVDRAQLAPERTAPSDWTPGSDTLQMLQPLWRGRARPREFARRLSTSALPPWALAAQGSSHAAVAAPRALLLRASEVGRRIVQRGARLP